MSDDYKDTVFLPKTDFPMRGGLPQKEPEILAQWDAMDLYAQMRKQAARKPKWILHDGPPYANGNIHMGHALNKILKDVVVKSWQMMGYDAPYVPGWDCHGLPIEWKIEEKYREAGKDKDDVDILSFRDECRRFAQEWVDIQSGQFQRLGVSGDWGKPYLTMRNRAEGKIAREIHKFALNGLLYKGAKPVMWSVVEKTALAEAEVEYKEHKSITIFVQFPIINPTDSFLEDAQIVIWTTTPWTIPSNRALACGEDVEYGIYRIDEVEEGSLAKVGDKLVLGKKLADNILTTGAKVKRYSDLGYYLKGKDIANSICAHPLRGQGYDFDVPMLIGDFVEDTSGTGFVHIAPGHGEDDFNLVVRHNMMQKAWEMDETKDDVDEMIDSIKFHKDKGIEITDNVDDAGVFRAHVPLFAGMEVYTQKGELGGGNFAVLKALTEAEKLLAKGSMRHEYPHSWRSKAPLIFRTTPQWFIAMDGKAKGSEKTLREASVSAIKDTRWVPAKGETRINAMIENRPDWCISRQRAWGVPIALFVHKDTGEVLIDEAVYDRIGTTFEDEGSDCWWHDGAAERFLAGTAYNAADYDQVFDIVDVWFESGSTHAFVVGDTQTWPDFEGVEKIDLYLEGSDQHRGWFHSSLLESVGTTGSAPYKSVLTHGFVLDEKGYKMSKSLGNVVDPLKMMEVHGADILRLWVMLSDTSEDIRIGQDTLKNTGDLYRRIRNTLRFLLGALDGFTKDEFIEFFERPEILPELEQLMLHRLFEIDAQVRGCIERYEFTKLAKLLHDFCNEDLSAFYFDIRKDSLYCDAPDSGKRRACRSVMAVIFNGLTAWLAPILAFTAEEAWSYRPANVFEDAQSVHLREFPAVPAGWQNNVLAAKWKIVSLVRKKVFEAIEPLRASKELGSSLEAKPVVYVSTEEAQALQGVDLAEVCITSQAVVEIGSPSRVDVEKAEGGKCARCWQVLPEVDVSQCVCNRCEAAASEVKARAA
jgi:isoleucyl-tRNA synthetase